MPKIPFRIKPGGGKPGLSNQAAAKNRKKVQRFVDKKSGKTFNTIAASRAHGIQQKIKAEKKAQALKLKATIVDKLKQKTPRTNIDRRGKYRSTVKMNLGAAGGKEKVGGLTPSQVKEIIKSNRSRSRIDAKKKVAGTHIYSLFGGLPRASGSTADELGKKEAYVYSKAEAKKGMDIEGEVIPKFRNKKGTWVQRKQKTVDYQIQKLDDLDISRGEHMGRKLTPQEKKQGYYKIFTTAAVASGGAATFGMVGTAYAEPGPAARPGDPMAGVVAIGGDFFQGVRNTASDWTFGATERGGVPSLDVETKSQFGKVTEGAMEQGGMYLFDQPSFQKHSTAGTLPLDQAWGKAGSFAAENPAMFAGEVLGEAAFWAGTMGIGRAVWGVGRGVKLAKLATGPHTTATKAQASQYATIGQGAKAGLKEAGAITKKDPFGIWSMGYGGIGKSGKLSGKTKHSVGVVPGFESLGQTNVGKLRRSAGKRYGKGYVKREKSKALQRQESQSWADWNPGTQLALPGAHAAKSLVKKGKKGTTITLKKKRVNTRKFAKFLNDWNDQTVRGFYRTD